MARITGVPYYEERMLCMLLLLRLPRTRVIYVTSKPIAEPIVDYYLHLLPGVPAQRFQGNAVAVAVADDDGYQAECIECHLQERKLHFETVFLLVRHV